MHCRCPRQSGGIAAMCHDHCSCAHSVCSLQWLGMIVHRDHAAMAADAPVNMSAASHAMLIDPRPGCRVRSYAAHGMACAWRISGWCTQLVRSHDVQGAMWGQFPGLPAANMYRTWFCSFLLFFQYPPRTDLPRRRLRFCGYRCDDTCIDSLHSATIAWIKAGAGGTLWYQRSKLSNPMERSSRCFLRPLLSCTLAGASNNSCPLCLAHRPSTRVFSQAHFASG